MTYTTGIPRSGQSLGNSRPQVQGNFDYINTAFAVNHVAFNKSNVGMHRVVDLVEQSSNPAPPLTVDTLFTKVAGTDPNPGQLGELFYMRGSGGPPNPPIQITNGDITNEQKGCSFLPGGLLIQWDKVTLSSGSKPVTFKREFRLNGNANNPWSVVLTLANSPVTATILGVSSSDISSTGFTINSVLGANQAVYYIAIGPST